jgi:hypothetical protein
MPSTAARGFLARLHSASAISGAASSSSDYEQRKAGL